MPMAGSSLTSKEISKIAAPLLFEVLFNWTLYGALCVQIYVYSYNFPDDRRWTKFMVYFVFALETAQTVLTGVDVYYWFVDGFGDIGHLHSSHYAPIDVPIMSSVTSPIAQLYFCYRIWMLTRNVWICTAIAVTTIASAVGSAWGGIASIVAKGYVVSNVALYLSSANALADIMIAAALTLLLRRIRAAEGSFFSRFVLGRVVQLTIETNILTATVAITSIVLYSAFPNEIYYVPASAIMGKLYSNTLLVSLNNRIYFRDHSIGSTTQAGDISHFTLTSRRSRAAKPSIHFAAGSTDTESRSPGEVFRLETITHTSDLEHGRKGDSSASISSVPRNGPGYDVKTDPSIAQSSALGRE